MAAFRCCGLPLRRTLLVLLVRDGLDAIRGSHCLLELRRRAQLAAWRHLHRNCNSTGLRWDGAAAGISVPALMLCWELSRAFCAGLAAHWLKELVACQALGCKTQPIPALLPGVSV